MLIWETVCSAERVLSHDTSASASGSLDAVFDMPGHLLRRCHQIAVAIFFDECEALDITPPQFVTLAALARHGPLDKAALGGVAALDRTTVAVVVKNLMQRGLVELRSSTSDRRAKIVAITSAGERMLDAARDAVDTAQDRMLGPLTLREREQFIRLLGKFARENNALSRAPFKLRRSMQAAAPD